MEYKTSIIFNFKKCFIARKNEYINLILQGWVGVGEAGMATTANIMIVGT